MQKEDEFYKREQVAFEQLKNFELKREQKMMESRQKAAIKEIKIRAVQENMKRIEEERKTIILAKTGLAEQR